MAESATSPDDILTHHSRGASTWRSRFAQSVVWREGDKRVPRRDRAVIDELLQVLAETEGRWRTNPLTTFAPHHWLHGRPGEGRRWTSEEFADEGS